MSLETLSGPFILTELGPLDGVIDVERTPPVRRPESKEARVLGTGAVAMATGDAGANEKLSSEKDDGIELSGLSYY